MCAFRAIYITWTDTNVMVRRDPLPLVNAIWLKWIIVTNIKIEKLLQPKTIFKESALGRFFHRVAMSVYLFVCLFVCPFHVLDFEAYFPSTFRSRMSKNFRYSESLGKSAGNKWSQIWTFLLGNGLKLPRKKKKFFADFALFCVEELVWSVRRPSVEP